MSQDPQLFMLRRFRPKPGFIFLNLILIFYAGISMAQTEADYILHAKIQDAQYPGLYLENIMLINLRTQQGTFINNNLAEIKIQPSDSLMISASGYALKKISFKDSSLADGKVFTISLKKLSVELKEVTIFQQREWNSIEKDLQGLGYKESDYKLSGVDAWRSPITSLYQAFSRKERSRRKVAELKNDDMRNALLTEIIHIYIKNKMITVKEDQLEDFIRYLSLNDETLKAMTQYELAMYIKARSAYFNNQH